MTTPDDRLRDLHGQVSGISNIAITSGSPQGTLRPSEPGTPNQELQASTIDPSAHTLDEPGPQIEPFEVSESWKQKTLLSFDGGGIRGYASLLMLRALMLQIGRIELEHSEGSHSSSYKPFERPKSARLETRITELDEGDLTEYLPCHYFDYIAGTSTGGLIATMLSRWRMSVKECITQYEKVGSQIFGANWRVSVLGFLQTKHSKKPLIRAIESLANAKTAKASGQVVDPKYQMFPAPPDLCRTIVFAIRKGKTTKNPNESTKKSRPADGPYLFRSYVPKPFDEISPPRNYGVDINIEIWKVCRATTAAPSYFDSQSIGDDEFCDGGAGVNNPTGKAVDELFSLHKKDVEIVASFGTGKWVPPSMFRDGNGHGLSRLHLGKGLAHVNRLLKNAKGALTDCQNIHKNVKRTARLLEGSPKAFHYYRFNVKDKLGKVKMNEYKEQRDDGKGGKCSTLEYIKRCTDTELGKPEVQNQLEALATRLVAQRRKRINDDPDMWERFTTCVQYKCAHYDCQGDGEAVCFNLRRELRDHLRLLHQTPSRSIEVDLDKSRQAPEFPTGPF